MAYLIRLTLVILLLTISFSSILRWWGTNHETLSLTVNKYISSEYLSDSSIIAINHVQTDCPSPHVDRVLEDLLKNYSDELKKMWSRSNPGSRKTIEQGGYIYQCRERLVGGAINYYYKIIPVEGLDAGSIIWNSVHLPPISKGFGSVGCQLVANIHTHPYDHVSEIGVKPLDEVSDADKGYSALHEIPGIIISMGKDGSLEYETYSYEESFSEHPDNESVEAKILEYLRLVIVKPTSDQTSKKLLWKCVPPDDEAPSNDEAPLIFRHDFPKNGTIGEKLLFRATACDMDGDTLYYSWDFGDDTAQTLFQKASYIQHTYSDTGVYEVTLDVMNNKNNRASIKSSINVGYDYYLTYSGYINGEKYGKTYNRTIGSDSTFLFTMDEDNLNCYLYINLLDEGKKKSSDLLQFRGPLGVGTYRVVPEGGYYSWLPGYEQIAEYSFIQLQHANVRGTRFQATSGTIDITEWRGKESSNPGFDAAIDIFCTAFVSKDDNKSYGSENSSNKVFTRVQGNVRVRLKRKGISQVCINEYVEYNRAGSDEPAFSHKPTSGAIVTKKEKAGTYLVGSYLSDIKYILEELDYPFTPLDEEFSLPKGEQFNLLNVSDEEYEEFIDPEEDWWFADDPGFFALANAVWVDAAVKRGNPIIIVSHPRYLYSDNEKSLLTGFGKEVHRLEWLHGYRYDPDRNRMVRNWSPDSLLPLTKMCDYMQPPVDRSRIVPPRNPLPGIPKIKPKRKKAARFFKSLKELINVEDTIDNLD